MFLLKFSLDYYREFLISCKNNGYSFLPISELTDSIKGSPVLYLRHDIDMHLYKVDEMATIENSIGAKATYYILPTAHYNILNPENINIIKKIFKLGHEIGLHYDLETFPNDKYSWNKYLDWQISMVEEIIGIKINTICMHQPFKGEPDPFLKSDKYVHPHNPKITKNMMYISDSCRAWRDKNLLKLLGPNPPIFVQLNTHPEVWFDGNQLNRIKYLDLLLENMCYSAKNYINNEVKITWSTHIATKLHDERENNK